MKAIKVIVSVCVVLVVLCWAGRADYAEQVVYNMNETTYIAITAKLGSDCSQYDIAKEYMDNKAFYDALGE